MDLLNDCTLVRLTKDFDWSDFDCDHVDLNEFFREDAMENQGELLGVTYILKHDKDERNLCAFTVANDSISFEKMPDRKKFLKEIFPCQKRTRKSYPSVLLARLGVDIRYQRSGIGIQVMDFIKHWFLIDNKTGCRFINVDSYNTDKALNYYRKCEFVFFYRNEEEEKEARFIPISDTLKTRTLFFDLFKLLE